jgi:hypothetical protein
MTARKNEGKVKAAGRWWTREEVFNFQRDWNDPLLTRREVCRIHGIRHVESVRWPTARRILGIAGEPRRKGGGHYAAVKLTVPKHAHPFVRKLIAEIIAQERTCLDVAKEAGLSRASFYKWRRVIPRLDNIEAALNTIGYKLIIVPMDADTQSLEQKAA